MRFFFALWAAKVTKIGLRIFRRRASYLPGAVALKLYPNFLARAGKPETVIAVTGTNGKTTVSNLLRDTMERLGLRVLSNRLGSNTAPGIATCLADGLTIWGRVKYDAAVFETDERYAPKIFPAILPQYVVVTNLFRDSIMRNAHPEFIASFLNRAMPPKTKLILNADDPISVGLSPESPRVYFGIERMETDTIACHNLINDMRVCPLCQTELVYDYRRYHHIGKCHCPACNYASPPYAYAGADVNIGAMTMTIRDAGGVGQYKLLSDSVFNIYNMVTVTAVLRELGYGHAEIGGAMAKTAILESRYNVTAAGDTSVVMQMSKDKNALAGSRAFDYAASRPGPKELILMMYCIRDDKNWSENTCWLYDCDFELLNRDEITRIVATGPRAPDYYLRLLLAGVPEEKLRCVMRELNAPDELEYPGGSVYIFYGTDAIELAYAVRDRAKALAEKKAEARA